MKALKLNNHFRHQEFSLTAARTKNYLVVLVLGLLLLLWPLAQRIAMWSDPTIGFIDPNIWLLLLLSLMFF